MFTEVERNIDQVKKMLCKWCDAQMQDMILIIGASAHL